MGVRVSFRRMLERAAFFFMVLKFGLDGIVFANIANMNCEIL